MPLSLHAASVPVFVRSLRALDAILDKAAAYCAARKVDPAVLGGTRLIPDMFALAKQVAGLSKAGKLVSVAGGGDTVAAISKFGITDQVSYISTGGGAFLEFLEGKKLPAVAILEERAEN